jgi:hypothetical protein
MSRTFVCIVFGLAMTLFSWYAPWQWPSLPALMMVRLFAGTRFNLADLPNSQRGAMLVLMIIINTALWALAAMLVWWIVQRLTARRRPVEPR